MKEDVSVDAAVVADDVPVKDTELAAMAAAALTLASLTASYIPLLHIFAVSAAAPIRLSMLAAAASIRHYRLVYCISPFSSSVAMVTAEFYSSVKALANLKQSET